jgi:uncharacterized protein GlcG (DUF336 family)
MADGASIVRRSTIDQAGLHPPVVAGSRATHRAPAGLFLAGAMTFAGLSHAFHASDLLNNAQQGQGRIAMSSKFSIAAMAVAVAFSTPAAFAEEDVSCPVSQRALKIALANAVTQNNGGLALNMWATIVNREGYVCAVAFSGADFQSQWPGSRVISAQKANTANAFNLGPHSNAHGHPGTLGVAGLALSTANLYSAVQPGGSLYGLQHSNPVDTGNAYDGHALDFGTSSDPLIGKRVGGVNVFGGGLGLYNADHSVVGGVGVSGDTSCTDHEIAWRVRNALGLDYLNGVNGVAALFGDAAHPDNIIYDITPNPDGGTGTSASGFGHPTCLNTPDRSLLPPVH